MYELLVRLYYELEYREFTIEELKEIKEILQMYKGEVLEVKLKRIKEDKGAIHTLKKEN